MYHDSSYTLELDCRYSSAPKEGDTFLLRTVRDERFEVIKVSAYTKPQRRPDGTTVTHHIRYRRKLP